MEGWFAWDGDGADVSGDGRLRISFDLTVLADDVEQFIGGIQHAARLVGTVTAPKLSPHPMAVSDGAFQLFYVDADEVETRYMHYRLSVTSGDGVVCRIDGKKLIRNESWRRLWPALTTLYVTIQEETGDKRHGHGVLHLSAPAFLRSLATVRASNTSGVLEGIDVKARLVGFFMDMARSMYGGITARPVLATLDAPVRARTRAVCRPMSYTVQTSDTTRVHLTRYQGGGRGPVILSPGFSVTADSFAADTVRENLVNFLCHRDYDVWLFDYRASSGFPAAGTRFSIDDIASRDYPAAVEKVLEVTHAGDVQIIAHCVGSLSLLMSLALGLLHARDRPGAGGPGARPNNLVRSVICSQLGLHPIAPRASEVKAALAVASALRHLGVRTISAHYDPYRVMHRMTDKLLSLYPTAERCNNPACRRILLLFGESFRHAQLNTATHDAIDQWFGTTSVPALSHLSLMLRARRAVDKDGRDVYLPHLDRLALPIAFMHGLCNLEFLPRSTLRTYRQLARRNGRGWYVRKRFPDYGHMDCFIGKNADRDIFPFIASELEEGPRRRG
jgi:cholesterol oxidase